MANGDNINVFGVANRTLPATASDGTYQVMRVSRRGEVITQPLTGSKFSALAAEGSYFVATNPTPGTGIAGVAAASSFDDTQTLLHIRNTDTTKNLHLDYLRLTVTAAGTNGTTALYAMKTDRGVTRRTSGGTAITPVNPNAGDSSTASVAMYFGPIVTAAATSDARLISNGNLRVGVIKVVGDTYLWNFGGSTQVVGAMAQAGTAVAQVVVNVAPVVLGPNDQFFLHEWAASQTVGSSYLFECGFWMR